MKRDILFAGTAGLVAGILLYGIAFYLGIFVPIFLESQSVVTLVFVILFGLALVEIPLMTISLRKMAQGNFQPRIVLLGSFAFYVSFAAVYAGVFVVITKEVGLGIVILALSVVRLASGVFIR